MIKNWYLNWRHRRNRKSWIWRAKHQKEDLGIGFTQAYIGYAYLFSVFRWVFKFLLLLLIIGCICGYWFYKTKLIPLYNKYNTDANLVMAKSSPDDFKINEGSVIYNSKGKVIANLYDTADNKYLTYEEIPKTAVDAFVAVEDRSYWTNTGIDPRGIARVLLRYYSSDGEEMHGASTITQQLARTVYLTREVSYERKLKEIFIARKLNNIYTKEQIMEFYVNNCCFANGIYGIEGAAQTYFNKSVDKLDLSQIAYLCAIPNSPEYYNPFVDKETAIPRRDKILEDMAECGYITAEERDNAKAETIEIAKQKYIFNDYETTYAVDCATKYLMRQSGFEFKYAFDTDKEYNKYHEEYDTAYEIAKEELYHGGYQIYTSLDSKLCEKLQDIIDENLSFNTEINELTGEYALQGALTVVDNTTNKVIGLVGGRSTDEEKYVYSFNRAYQAYRQPGSSFKPIAVYTPALQLGYNADSKVQNIDVKAAAKKGADAQKMSGKVMTLRSAVEQSQNGVAWQIFDKITPQYGLSFIANMRFSNLCKDDYNDAAALGGLTYGATTAEMASAYNCLAKHGQFTENTCIESIIDNTGKEIYIEEHPFKVYNAKAADDMVDILKGVITKGTAAKLGWYGRTNIEAFAKTGTTNQSKDGWLCGATPYYSIAVWVGFDQPKELSNLYGATYPGQIWKSAMLTLVEDLDTAKFERADYSNEEGFVDNSDMIGDDEITDDYTQEDYDADREVGKEIQDIISRIKNEKNSTMVHTLHNDALALLENIKSDRYRNKMKLEIEKAYTEYFKPANITEEDEEDEDEDDKDKKKKKKDKKKKKKATTEDNEDDEDIEIIEEDTQTAYEEEIEEETIEKKTTEKKKKKKATTEEKTTEKKTTEKKTTEKKTTEKKTTEKKTTEKKTTEKKTTEKKTTEKKTTEKKTTEAKTTEKKTTEAKKKKKNSTEETFKVEKLQ